MKNIIYFVIFLVVIFGAYFLVKRNKESEKILENINTAQNIVLRENLSLGSYNVSTTESVINWSGKRPLIEGYLDSGIVNLKNGQAIVAEDNISGNFVIDLNTIKVINTSKVPGGEGNLEKHLKSADFFDVAKFPEAKFEIMGSKAYEDVANFFMYDITGKLTIKDTTNEIVFPAKIYEREDGKVMVEADIKIDRTKWGVKYGSGSFFKNLADKVIDDEVSLGVRLVAEKAEN